MRKRAPLNPTCPMVGARHGCSGSGGALGACVRGKTAVLVALGLVLLMSTAWVQADRVADPPSIFGITLTPVLDADTSGAEPLMQEALAAARSALSTQLAAAAPDRDELAEAYGRLGALLVLVEVEAQADACLRNAMALQPEAFRWPYYAGYLALLAGNLDRAVEALEQARAIDPSYSPLYLRLGKAHLDRSELDQAHEALTRAAAEPSLTGVASYYLGQIALLQRRFEDAVRLLEAALEANPNATEVHYPLAQAHRALGHDAQARAHLDAFDLREPEVADPLIAELQAVTDRSLPAFKEALHAVRGGDYAQAVQRFADGLAIAPDNVAARISYARVLWLTGAHDQASAELAQVLAQAPDAPLALFLVGVIAEHRGDVAAAKRLYRQVLVREPAHAGAWFQLANLAFRAEDYSAAAVAYREVLAVDDDVAPARLLALVAERRGGASDATVLGRLRSVVATYPDDPQLRYALARLLAATADADLQDAAAALNLAAKLNADLSAGGPIPPHRRALALARAAAGDDAGAVALLRPLQAAAWMLPPAEAALLDAELARYGDGRLPEAWPVDDPLLAPPLFSADQVMRDYPAAKPY